METTLDEIVTVPADLIEAIQKGDLDMIRGIYASGIVPYEITATSFSDAVRHGRRDVALFLADYLDGTCELTWPAVRTATRNQWDDVTGAMGRPSVAHPVTPACG